MAIDSSIYSLIRPTAPAADPLEQYGKTLSLTNAMGQNDLQTLQTGQLRKKIADESEISDASKASSGNLDTFKKILYDRGHFEHAQKVEKLQAEQQKDQAALLKTTLESNQLAVKTLADATAKLAPGESTESLRPLIGKLFKPEEAARMIAKMDADNPGGVATQGWITKSTQNSEILQKNLEAALTRQTTERGQNMTSQTAANSLVETGRHNKATEGIAAGTLAETKAEHGRVAARYNDQASKDKVQIVTNTDGTFTVVDKNTRVGKPVIDEKGNELKGRQNMTESQGKAAGMLHRATAANDILNGLEDEGFKNRGVLKQAAGAIPLVGGAAEMGVNMLPGALGGPNQQQQRVEQARRDFVNAALRVESGAAISESEFRNAERQYFPMPGDSKEVLAQKRANRATELEALKLQAGPGQPKPKLPGEPARTPSGGVSGIKFLGFEE